jgi:hypothetical protein
MGMNEIANPNVDNNIGIQDELGMEALNQMKESLEKELKIFTDNRDDLIKGKENYLAQWEVDKRIAELQMEGDNLKPIDPKTPLEANDEYFELFKKKLAFKHRFDVYKAEEELKKFDTQIQVMQEQIDSAEKKLKEM